MPNEDNMKEFTVATNQMIDAFEKLSGDMSDNDKNAFNAVFGGSRTGVGLRDTDKFRMAVDIISSDEIRELRRDIASAIAAEKYTEGFMMAFKVMSLLGGL